MTLQWNLQTAKARLLYITLVLVSGYLFINIVLSRFVIASICEPQLEINQETLAIAVQHFPKSAGIHTRLAARLIESGVSKGAQYEEIAQQGVEHSLRAVQLAPSKYEAWVLLSAARELTGDFVQAEKDLRTALTLAPQHTALHWQLANLWLREEKLEFALPEFRRAIDADPTLLLPTLRLLWQATNADFNRVAAVVKEEPKSQLIWARFLAEQSQAVSAIDVFSRMDSQLLFDLPESSQLLDILIAAKEFVQADRGWQHLYGQRHSDALIWNGGFETPARKGLSQFDWRFSDSRYVRVSLVSNQKRTGSRALGIEYLGIETTKLDTEVKQLIVVRPGHSYRLACYAKTDSLETADGPRVVVTKIDTPTIVAETVVVSGSHDWQLLTADFIAPAETFALLVTIKQTPHFSYSAPTRGMVWFDDLTVQEQ